MNDREAITFGLRACWVRADNLRLSRTDGPFPEPSLRALVVEHVEVAESERRRGVFTRFLNDVCERPGYDLFVVEGVGNPILADALMRWGWDFDAVVMDFYRRADHGGRTGADTVRHLEGGGEAEDDQRAGLRPGRG